MGQRVLAPCSAAPRGTRAAEVARLKPACGWLLPCLVQRVDFKFNFVLPQLEEQRAVAAVQALAAAREAERQEAALVRAAEEAAAEEEAAIRAAQEAAAARAAELARSKAEVGGLFPSENTQQRFACLSTQTDGAFLQMQHSVTVLMLA